MEFLETRLFTEVLPGYLTDDEYRQLQAYLAVYPEAGDLMPGTGGFRKLRWTDQRRRKGKRGGLRVIYYHLVADMTIWLFTLYDKDEATDLSLSEKRLLRVAIDEETRRRRGRRRPKRT